MCIFSLDSRLTLINQDKQPTTHSTISPKSIKPILSPPPTPLIPQRSKAQYHNVNSDQNQPKLSNNNDLSHEENTCAESGKENPNIKSQFTNAESPDYETVYSGMFCRLLPPPSSSGSKNINTSQSSPVTSLPSVPMTPTLQKLSAAINSNNSVIKLKSVLKKKQSNPTDKNDKSASGKNVGVKKLKNGPKSGREKGKMPVKKPKKRPKMAFTGTFDFHGEKKNTEHGYRTDFECYSTGYPPDLRWVTGG